jgi:hypothetical protein
MKLPWFLSAPEKKAFFRAVMTLFCQYDGFNFLNDRAVRFQPSRLAHTCALGEGLSIHYLTA